MHDSHAGPGPHRDPEEPDDGHDVDAEFAAMMEGLELPDEMRADLEALDAGTAGSPDAAEGPGDGAFSVTAAEVPHNTYAPPHGEDRAEEDADDLDPQAAAEARAMMAALEADLPEGEAGAPRAVKVAVVLTPLGNAQALASLCAMSDLDCTVVPASSGAFAVKEFVSAHAEWDVSELLGGSDTEPAEAAELASALSRLSRDGVVLLTADLATDVGIESGLSGTVQARSYVGGNAGEEVSAGLVLSAVDQRVEDVVLGVVCAENLPGAVRSSDVRPGRAMRWLGGFGRRRPHGGAGDGTGGRE